MLLLSVTITTDSHWFSPKLLPGGGIDVRRRRREVEGEGGGEEGEGEGGEGKSVCLS